MSRSIDGAQFSDISSTPAAFFLAGGKYGVDVVATGSGTVKLQKLAGDGATFVSVSTATDFATTAGYAVVDLPSGKYTFTIDTFTAVYAELLRIPGE